MNTPCQATRSHHLLKFLSDKLLPGYWFNFLSIRMKHAIRCSSYCFSRAKRSPLSNGRRLQKGSQQGGKSSLQVPFKSLEKFFFFFPLSPVNKFHCSLYVFSKFPLEAEISLVPKYPLFPWNQWSRSLVLQNPRAWEALTRQSKQEGCDKQTSVV